MLISDKETSNSSRGVFLPTRMSIMQQYVQWDFQFFKLCLVPFSTTKQIKGPIHHKTGGYNEGISLLIWDWDGFFQIIYWWASSSTLFCTKKLTTQPIYSSSKLINSQEITSYNQEWCEPAAAHPQPNATM